MNIYNTLTKKTDKIVPIKREELSIYSCGPTVYNRVHIGNLSSFIYADTLRRVAEQSGLRTKHVMNYTDVDDKTIKKAQEFYTNTDPMSGLIELTNKEIEQFITDAEKVGIATDNIQFVKATDNIEGMKRLIESLVKEGYAYIASDGIYFSIRKYQSSGKKYGQLSNISAESTGAARIDNDEYDKNNVHDFALWKFHKDNEPFWDFEIDNHNYKGRPGWHIECSAMSEELLGKPFDVHTGGIDLIFPHHENEIAQSTALSGYNLANYFVHNEHMLIDGHKMSKSLNNFYTLEEIMAKKINPLALRMLVLQSHYKSQAHFSWDNLLAAENRLKTYRNMADMKWQPSNNTNAVTIDQINKTYNNIIETVEDNLDTPKGLAILSQLEGAISNNGIAEDATEDFGKFLLNIDDIFGLRLTGKDINLEIKQIIKDRQTSKDVGDYELADKYRDQLQDLGYGIRDISQGSIWYRL